MPDEAYYWTWSQHPAWGYFDHPPVIAIMIRCGYWLIKNELGVRLLAVCNITAFIFIIEKLIKPVNLLLFYCTILSVAILHFFGFIAVPDNPLILLTASFFYLYRAYLKKEGRVIIILLVLNISLLLLSKYHSTLIIVFTILSNPSLLKRRSAWIIGILSLVLVTPHIIWQYENGAPSIVFQLFQRAHERYSISLTSDYLASLLVVFGPVSGTILLFVALKYKPEGLFEKALKYTLTGTLLFFTLMTFKGRVETNWVIFTIVPVLILGYKSMTENNRYHKTMIYSFPVTILIIMLVRVFLVYDFLPAKWQFENDFHGYREWAKKVKEKSGGRPVVFMNSYQNAAEYEFYTGQSAFSLNNMSSRKNQYNLWYNEQMVQGKEIMLNPNYTIDWLGTISTERGPFQYWVIPNFRSSSDIIVTSVEKRIKAKPTEPLFVHFTFSLRKGCEADLESNKDYPAFISYDFYEARKRIIDTVTNFHVMNKMLKNKETYTVRVNPPGKKGKYQLFLSIKCGMLPQSINSEGITVEVY